MVREAADDAAPALEADDALHDADGDFGTLEIWALFDVEFEIRGEGSFGDARVGEMSGILAVALEPFGYGDAFIVFACEDFGAENAGGDRGAHRADAEVIAFLVGPDDDFERMTRCDVVFVESADDFDSGDDADGAVESATVEDGVDVRAEEERREFV